jgi:hypothetical protein
LRNAIADIAVRFRCTDGDGGICAHSDHYPQVGRERASTKKPRSPKYPRLDRSAEETFSYGFQTGVGAWTRI